MGTYGESEQRCCSDQGVDGVVEIAVGFCSRIITYPRAPEAVGAHRHDTIGASARKGLSAHLLSSVAGKLPATPTPSSASSFSNPHCRSSVPCGAPASHMKYSGPLKIRAREVVSSVIEARRTHARTFGRSERLGAILARSDQAQGGNRRRA